jgi:hypothetical protein
LTFGGEAESVNFSTFAATVGESLDEVDELLGEVDESFDEVPPQAEKVIAPSRQTLISARNFMR